MTKSEKSTTQPHFEILDGLRGVAAVMVVAFHILETFTDGNHLAQIINHGYLAVDFFYVLSGFVIGYAYDNRWSSGLTLGDFFKRRLVRLHPMIVVGTLVGLAFYFFGASSLFPLIGKASFGQMAVAVLMGLLLLPMPPALDVRGWQEMFPLNGPMWTLFYEYVANILYALFFRKLSNTVLAMLAFFAACALVQFATSNATGDLIGGWSVEPAQLRVGLMRLFYPFLAGLLLSRLVQPRHFTGSFWISGLLLAAVLAFPRIGGDDNLWQNGLYDALSVIILFPLVVFIGASGTVMGAFSQRFYRFLGEISYPIYIVHYPLIYVFTAWVVDGHRTLATTWPVGLVVFVASIGLAYFFLKVYDLPVRRWLASVG